MDGGESSSQSLSENLGEFDERNGRNIAAAELIVRIPELTPREGGRAGQTLCEDTFPAAQ